MNLEANLSRLRPLAAGGSELAHLPPFRLGPLRVEPGLRRLVGLRGQARTIQPLAMRVLLSLSEAQGETSSRDDLVEACWNQRIVGDDAVHRIISTLRRDLAQLSGGAVRIETISKVGYRLLFDDESATEDPDNGRTAAISSRPSARRPFAPLAATGALIVIGLLAWSFAPLEGTADAATTRIGVEPISNAANDSQAARFASDLTGDLARLASAVSRVSIVDRTRPGQAADSDFLIRIAVERDAGGLTAIARMVATDDGSVFWSRRFLDEEGNLPRLRERVAVNTAGIIRCGLEKAAGEIEDPTSLKLFLGACDAFQNENPAVARSFALRLVEREPENVLGWSCLALAALDSDGADDPTGTAARKEVEGFVRRALAIDPQNPRAIIAALKLERDELPAIDLIERGLRGEPASPDLLGFYATSLFNAGYVKESVEPALRALAFDPTSRYAYELAVRRLLSAGRFSEALAMLERVERLWPGHPEVLSHRARLLAYWPDRREAVVILQNLETQHPRALEHLMAPFAPDVVRWRAYPATIDMPALERLAETRVRADPPEAWHVVSALAAMNQPERALVWLDRAPKRRAVSQWSILFAPHAAELRRDPRFFRAMAELGLVDLWVKRGQWPDFCSEPGLRYSCARAAAELGAPQITSKARQS